VTSGVHTSVPRAIAFAIARRRASRRRPSYAEKRSIAWPMSGTSRRSLVITAPIARRTGARACRTSGLDPGTSRALPADSGVLQWAIPAR
jgi:hypothetical protein